MILQEKKFIIEDENENWPLEKYYFVQKYITPDSIVLDAACGTGFGSMLLAQKAKKVVAIDIDEPSIKRARASFSKDNLNFLEADVKKTTFPDDYFDVIVSIETIEHLTEADQALFLQELKRVLKKEGVLIISTPDKEVALAQGFCYGDFHEKEFNKEEFLELLKSYFNKVELFGQGPFVKLSWGRKVLNFLKKIDVFKIRKLSLLKKYTKKIDRFTSPVKFDYSLYPMKESEPDQGAIHLIGICRN